MIFQRHKLLAIAKNNNDLCIRRGGKREEYKHNKNLLPYIPHFKVSHTIIKEIFFHILYRNRSYHRSFARKNYKYTLIFFHNYVLAVMDEYLILTQYSILHL